jgi:DNA-binding CsgD family transcriptional regulator
MPSSEILRSTTEAGFLLDSRCRILEWNSGAEELLEHSASDVVGAYCWEVLAGVDVFGNTFCSAACPLRQMIRAREPVHPFELYLRQASRNYRRVRMSTLVLRPGEPEQTETVHLLDPVVVEPDKEHEASHLRQLNRFPHGELTAREMEVLEHLAAGKSTNAIARAMGISAATARNHICHVLHKLDAHSRLEAVAKSRLLGIV